MEVIVVDLDMTAFFILFFAEEKSPPAFDHRGPAASLTGDGDGAKWPERRAAAPGRPPRPRNTLVLQIKGWSSPVGHRGLGFPTRGGQEDAAPGTRSQRQSRAWLSGTGWCGDIAPWGGQRLRDQAGGVSCAPPGMLETPSPLPDGVSLGFSCFPASPASRRWLFPTKPPPGLPPDEDLGGTGEQRSSGRGHPRWLRVWLGCPSPAGPGRRLRLPGCEVLR